MAGVKGEEEVKTMRVMSLPSQLLRRPRQADQSSRPAGGTERAQCLFKQFAEIVFQNKK